MIWRNRHGDLVFRTLRGAPLHARSAVVALMVCRKLLAELHAPACQALLCDVNGIGAVSVFYWYRYILCESCSQIDSPPSRRQGHIARICAELESLRLRLRNYIAVSPRCGTAEQWAGGVANVEAVQSSAWCAEGVFLFTVTF